MIVGICEDMSQLRKFYAVQCQKYFDEMGQDVEIKMFADGDELETEEPDILLLDIGMPKKNGIQVKDEFQIKKKRTLIIFITAYDYLMQEAFGANVIGFVRKSHEEFSEKIPVLLRKAFELIKGGDKKTDIPSETIFGFNIQDIKYIELDNIYCQFHLLDGIHLLRMSGKKLEDDFGDKGIVRIHKSFLVNVRFIKEIKDSNIILLDGTLLPLRKRGRKLIKEKINNCIESIRD